MHIYEFLAGLLTAGFLLGGLFFLRFWTRTGDSLFLAFAVAFWLFAAGQALLGLTSTVLEERSWIYLLRVAGFVLIIVAVIAKNAKGAR